MGFDGKVWASRESRLNQRQQDLGAADVGLGLPLGAAETHSGDASAGSVALCP